MHDGKSAPDFCTSQISILVRSKGKVIALCALVNNNVFEMLSRCLKNYAYRYSLKNKSEGLN